MEAHEETATFHFAHEIESAVVSLLWHEPERCGEFFRELDPDLHLSQPNLRVIAQAISLTWRELGTTDFAIVVQMVRELSGLEEAGGIEGLNSVYLLKQFRADKETTDAIFSHYLEMLKAYALGRQNNMAVYRFNRGDILLVQNKLKNKGNGPDLIGQGKIAGRRYRAIGYHQTQDDSYSISLIPE